MDTSVPLDKTCITFTQDDGTDSVDLKFEGSCNGESDNDESNNDGNDDDDGPKTGPFDFEKWYEGTHLYSRVGGQGLCAPFGQAGTGFLSDVRGKVASKQECFDLCSARSQCSGVSYHDDWKQCEVEARNFDALVAQFVTDGGSTEKGTCVSVNLAGQTGCTIEGITNNGHEYECWKKVTGVQMQYFKDATCDVPWGNTQDFAIDQCEQKTGPWGSMVAFGGCSEHAPAPGYIGCGGCSGPAGKKGVADCETTQAEENYEAPAGDMTCWGATLVEECVQILDSVYVTLKPISAQESAKLQVNDDCDPRNDRCDQSIDLHCHPTDYSCRYKTTSTATTTTTKLPLNADCDPRNDLCDASIDLHCHPGEYSCRYITTTTTATSTTTSFTSTTTTVSSTTTTTTVTSTTTSVTSTTTSVTSTTTTVTSTSTTTVSTTTNTVEAAAARAAAKTKKVTIIGSSAGVAVVIIIAVVIVVGVLRKSSAAPTAAPTRTPAPAGYENPMYAANAAPARGSRQKHTAEDSDEEDMDC